MLTLGQASTEPVRLEESPRISVQRLTRGCKASEQFLCLQLYDLRDLLLACPYSRMLTVTKERSARSESEL